MALTPSSSSSSTTAGTVLKRYRLPIYLLTLTAIILRSEIAVLLASFLVYHLIQYGPIILRPASSAGIAGAVIGLLITLSIDSFFWLRFPIWPELVGFYYNAIQGNSVNWGTSPWWYYFGNTLPRLLLNPITWGVCIPFAVWNQATRKPSLDILLPLLGFIGIYSLQPHKEWRFIVYAIPSFTAVAALGANWIWTRRGKNMFYRILSLAVVGSTLASFGVSCAMLAISRLNYPGAEALRRVHEWGSPSQYNGIQTGNVISLHMDTLSCTTGITRFLEKTPQLSPSGGLINQSEPVWRYDKTEDPEQLLDPLFWDQFDYVLSERPEKVIGKWEILDTVYGFTGITVVHHVGDEREDEEEDDGQVTTADGGHDDERRHSRHGGRKAKKTEKKEEDTRSKMMEWLRRTEWFMKRYITGGWWMEIRMEPQIRILKKQTT